MISWPTMPWLQPWMPLTWSWKKTLSSADVRVPAVLHELGAGPLARRVGVDERPSLIVTCDDAASTEVIWRISMLSVPITDGDPDARPELGDAGG